MRISKPAFSLPRIALFLSLLTALVVQTAQVASAQAPLDQIAVVHSFTGGADGSNPAGPLIQLPNGNFAGMTFGIGVNKGKPATVFTMTPSGTVTTLYTFAADSSEGAKANGVILASDGNFYGTCSRGGPFDQGTLFRLTTAGVFTQLYNFPTSAGFFEPGSVIEAPDGYLYGGAGGGATGFGALFRFSLKTGQTTLFYSYFPDLVGPTQPSSGISIGPDGRFYGSTLGYYSEAGVYSPGAAYAIDLAGNLVTLAIYDGVIGNSFGAPIFPGDGYAYFAGNTGGNDNECLNGCGSIFRVAMDGSGAELLYSFTGGTDGYAPQTVTQGSDGQFYGYDSTYIADGSEPAIFQVNLSGAVGAAFPFPAPGNAYAYQLFAPLLQSAGGVFRGLSQKGGADTAGASFVLNAAAPPVPPTIYAFSPASGDPGTVVTVWGVNFVGLSGVTLSGLPAQGAARSSNFVRFVVPQSATSGPITITTATGAATSNEPFMVQ